MHGSAAGELGSAAVIGVMHGSAAVIGVMHGSAAGELGSAAVFESAARLLSLLRSAAQHIITVLDLGIV